MDPLYQQHLGSCQKCRISDPNLNQQSGFSKMWWFSCSSTFEKPRVGNQRRQWQPTPVLLPGKSHGQRSLVDCSPWGREESDTTERLHFLALEKEMATHSSILAWRIPWMGKPDGLPSTGSHRVGHDWSDLAAALECFYFLLLCFSLNNFFSFFIEV